MLDHLRITGDIHICAFLVDCLEEFEINWTDVHPNAIALVVFHELFLPDKCYGRALLGVF